MAEPVTLEEAKAQCRVLSDDEDGLIDSLIIAAREWVENFTGLILAPRTVTQAFDEFSTRNYLNAWPIAADAVPDISYLDGDGVAQTVTNARLLAGTRPARIWPAIGEAWPATHASPEAVTVSIDAGYAAPEDVPQSLKQAMLLLIEEWFDNRGVAETGTVMERPVAVEALCRPHRLPVIG